MAAAIAPIVIILKSYPSKPREIKVSDRVRGTVIKITVLALRERKKITTTTMASNSPIQSTSIILLMLPLTNSA
jgi:hypothetical protein